jgi:hypothetical protein
MKFVKKAERLGNGMVKVWTVNPVGGGLYEYKTWFGQDRAVRRYQRIGYRVHVWESWKCEGCGYQVDSEKWAAKHKCK